MARTFTTRGAAAKFRRIVAQKVARGMGHGQAVRDTARKNPKLHALMLLEASPRASRDVKNSIRERGGLALK